MILNIKNNNYKINEMSPLLYDMETSVWEPITISLKDNFLSSDLKGVKRLIIKEYINNQDAEIVANNEIIVSENTIMIPEVLYCSILN